MIELIMCALKARVLMYNPFLQGKFRSTNTVTDDKPVFTRRTPAVRALFVSQ